MIKIDLITGFLGAGKTTFIRKYAKYLMDSGKNIGILENDFGAVNVDMMMLQDLMGDHFLPLGERKAIDKFQRLDQNIGNRRLQLQQIRILVTGFHCRMKQILCIAAARCRNDASALQPRLFRIRFKRLQSVFGTAVRQSSGQRRIGNFVAKLGHHQRGRGNFGNVAAQNLNGNVIDFFHVT